MPEQIVKHLIMMIVESIDYFHGLGVCHRDLKPDNILVDYEHDKSVPGPIA